jgi:hypothetical protein
MLDEKPNTDASKAELSGSAAKTAPAAAAPEPGAAPSSKPPFAKPPAAKLPFAKEGEPMEIHAPEKPIHSRKEFLFHMFTVVLGILIALGLEGIVEWAHHRALVREARENITAEIQKNKETIDGALLEYQQRGEALHHVIDAVHRLEKTHHLNRVETMNFGMADHDLYSTAWQTATTSGAVTYMSYDELRHYTDVYMTQQTFSVLQAQAIDKTIDLGSLIQATMEDQKSVSNEKFQAIARETYREMILQKALEDVSKELSKAYVDLIKQP